MICTNCGNETQDQRLSCIHCGLAINKECPRCAEIIKIKAKACRFCGYEFEFSESADSKSPMATRVKVVPNTIEIKPVNSETSDIQHSELFDVTKWFWWTVANVIAGALAFSFIKFIFSNGVNRIIFQNFSGNIRFILLGGIGGILLGTIFGLIQQFLVRHIYPPAKWFWVTLLGYWLGNTIAFSLKIVDFLPEEIKFDFILPFLLIGLTIGVVQVLSFQQLKQNFSTSAFWVFSSLLAWTLDVVILKHFLGVGRDFEVVGINSIFPNPAGYIDSVAVFRQISSVEYMVNGIIRGFLIGILSGLNLHILHSSKSWAKPKTLGFVAGIIALVCIPIWSIWFFATLRQLEVTMATTSTDVSNQNIITEPPIVNTLEPPETIEPTTSSIIGKWEVVSGTSIGSFYEFFEDGTVSVGGIAGKYSFPDESHLKIEAGIPFVYTYYLSSNEITLTEPTLPTTTMKRYEEFNLTPQTISGKWQRAYPDNSGCFKGLGIELTPQNISLESNGNITITDSVNLTVMGSGLSMQGQYDINGSNLQFFASGTMASSGLFGTNQTQTQVQGEFSCMATISNSRLTFSDAEGITVFTRAGE